MRIYVIHLYYIYVLSHRAIENLCFFYNFSVFVICSCLSRLLSEDFIWFYHKKIFLHGKIFLLKVPLCFYGHIFEIILRVSSSSKILTRDWLFNNADCIHFCKAIKMLKLHPVKINMFGNHSIVSNAHNQVYGNKRVVSVAPGWFLDEWASILTNKLNYQVPGYLYTKHK